MLPIHFLLSGILGEMVTVFKGDEVRYRYSTYSNKANPLVRYYKGLFILSWQFTPTVPPHQICASILKHAFPFLGLHGERPEVLFPCLKALDVLREPGLALCHLLLLSRQVTGPLRQLPLVLMECLEGAEGALLDKGEDGVLRI